MSKHFIHNGKFLLESGETLPTLDIAYNTYGSMNEERSNIIWVCHALTANSEVAEWWPHTVETGCFLDPDKWFVVCANFIGSHYGTTGPLSINPLTGSPWYGDFPKFTIRDMVRAHMLLAGHLGIDHVRMLIGSSIGGFQCMEWSIMYPDFAGKVVLIATTSHTRPWAAAFNETQRMAIECDPTFGDSSPDAGLDGMAVARSMALLSYRGGQAYDKTQCDDINDNDDCFKRKVHSYQRYQGEKLRRRFNAYSYYRLSQAVDSHDVSRGRGTVKDALGLIKAQCLIVAISSDILFPPEDHYELVEYIPGSRYHLISSDFGHDGFLVEHKQLNDIILDFTLT